MRGDGACSAAAHCMPSLTSLQSAGVGAHIVRHAAACPAWCRLNPHSLLCSISAALPCALHALHAAVRHRTARHLLGRV